MSLSLEFMMVIYVITHVATGRQYVGQTVKKGKHRWREHCNAGRRTNSRVTRSEMYITRALRKHGVEAFTLQVIEQCSTLQDLDDREAFWVKELNTLSPNGFNCREGGKQSRLSPDVVARVADQLRGRKRSKETCEAISRGSMGKVLSAETKMKLSVVQLGKKRGPHSKEHRRKIGDGNRGKVITEQHRRQIGESNRRRGPLSAETREKLSKVMLGRKHTPESKEKMRKSWEEKRHYAFAVKMALEFLSNK